jgi:DNA-binding YbaB/EbfC family protein
MAVDFQKMMAEAQKMQQKMQDVQKELGDLTIIGSAGAGAVKVKINGRYEVLNVTIVDSLMHEGKEMLEQLTAAAFNDAVQKLERVSKDKIVQLTSNIQLPEDLLNQAGGEGTEGGEGDK